MARRTTRRTAEPAPTPAPGDSRVPVVIRAGHTHAGVLYRVDTPYQATAREAALLERFGALVGPD